MQSKHPGSPKMPGHRACDFRHDDSCAGTTRSAAARLAVRGWRRHRLHVVHSTTVCQPRRVKHEPTLPRLSAGVAGPNSSSRARNTQPPDQGTDRPLVDESDLDIHCSVGRTSPAVPGRENKAVLARRGRDESIEDRSTADPGLSDLCHEAQGTGLREKPRRGERSGDRRGDNAYRAAISPR